MARYIDADAFLRRAESMYCLGCEKRMGIKNGKKTFIYGIGGVPCRACEVDDMKDDIENAPTADVVEVVRCADCKFYDEAERMCNDTNGFDRYWKPTDFCSYGERRTDDDRNG